MSEQVEAINPRTGKQEFECSTMDPRDVTRDIIAADECHLGWGKSPLGDRTALLRRLAERLESEKEHLAELMAVEMGKPITQGRKEVEKCAWVCRFYAEEGPRFLEPREVKTEKASSYVCYRSLGVILAVMPWNFPFWQVFRFAAPNVMAGNTILLKHASNVPRCALAIEELFRLAEAPSGLFKTLLVPSSLVDEIVAYPLVKGVTLTGGTKAGRSVAAAAGAAMKKSVFELGGSDPYVILEDADLELAARICAKSRLTNGGQSCIAAKRFIVVEPVRERFEELMVERLQEVKMGDPLLPDTELGPLADFDLRDNLQRQVTESIAGGAVLRLGGTCPLESPFDQGSYYPPTVLSAVKPGMPAHDEELFGPVAAIVPAGSPAEAIQLANGTQYGLGAAVFTQDEKEGERIAREELEAGTCVVNDMVASDPRLPFGGIKESGYGRELSAEGIREFVNIKTVATAA